MPVKFDGSPVSLTTQGSHLADAADLVVRNSEGVVVFRGEIDPERQDYEWAGVGESGALLPTGTYDITVESFSQGELIATDPVEVHAKIVEARNDLGVPVLVMDTGQEVDSGRILGLRAPGT